MLIFLFSVIESVTGISPTYGFAGLEGTKTFLSGSAFNASTQYYCNVTNLVRNRSAIVYATVKSQLQLKCILVWPYEEAIAQVQVYKNNAAIPGTYFFNFQGAHKFPISIF